MDGPSGVFGYMAGSRPGPMIHGMAMNMMNGVVQPCSSLVCVGASLESQDPKTVRQVLEQETVWHVNAWHVNTWHINTESSRRPSETHLWSCGWYCHPHSFPIPVFLAVLPVLPGSARAIRFPQTSFDFVSFGNEVVHLPQLPWPTSQLPQQKHIWALVALYLLYHILCPREGFMQRYRPVLLLLLPVCHFTVGLCNSEH